MARKRTWCSPDLDVDVDVDEDAVVVPALDVDVVVVVVVDDVVDIHVDSSSPFILHQVLRI